MEAEDGNEMISRKSEAMSLEIQGGLVPPDFSLLFCFQDSSLQGLSAVLAAMFVVFSDSVQP